MAENKDDAQDTPWLITTFHFTVDFDGTPVAFKEVSGLDTEHDVVEYRSGNSPVFSTLKMPGLSKFSEITLKKGLFKDDAALLEYFASIQTNTVARKTITVSLMDENGDVLFAWTLKNAFPTKVTGTSINAQGDYVAIEEIVLAHEGLTITQGG